MSVVDAVMNAGSPMTGAAAVAAEQCGSCGETLARPCSVCEGAGRRALQQPGAVAEEACVGCNGRGAVRDLHVCWSFR